MQDVKIKTDFIKLSQLLKLAGLVGLGGEAKVLIQQGNVKVNGTVVLERGKKIVKGDMVEFNGDFIKVC